MPGIDLPAVWDAANSGQHNSIATALVTLWVALQEDAELLGRARHAAGVTEIDDPSRDRRLGALVDAGRRGLPLPSEFRADPLTVAAALDVEFAGGERTTPAPRPRSRVATVQHPLGQFLVQVRCRPYSRHARQKKLPHWFRHCRIVPRRLAGHCVEIVRMPRSSSQRLTTSLRGLVRVTAATFSQHCELDARPATQNSFIADGLANETDRWREIEALLQRVRDRTHVVVLPELSVTPALRARISSWLATNHHRIQLVLAGSFHERVSEHERPVNRAVLLGSRGERLMWHDKLAAFIASGELPAGAAHLREEHIHPGNVVRLLDTPFGLLAVAICLDHCDDLAPELWRRVEPDLLLVPAMNPQSDLRSYLAAAKKIGRAGNTVSVVAAQPEIAGTTLSGVGPRPPSQGRRADPNRATNPLHPAHHPQVAIIDYNIVRYRPRRSKVGPWSFD